MRHLALCLAFASLALVATARGDDDDPDGLTWEGRPIAAIAADLVHEDLGRRRTAVDAITLLALKFFDPDDEVGRTALGRSIAEPLGRLLQDEQDKALRLDACEAAFRVARPAAAALVAGLEACVLEPRGDEELRTTAVQALASIGEAAAPSIVRAVQHDDERVAGAARWALGNAFYADLRRACEPLLLERLAPGESPARRAAAASGLATMLSGNGVDDALVRRIGPPLAALVASDPARDVRHAAAGGLSNLGSRAAFAVPELVAGLSFRDDGLADTLVATLAAVGSAAVAPLASAIDGQDPLVARRAMAPFRRMPPEVGPAPAAAALGRRLGSSDVKLRREAALVLGSFGTAADDAGAALLTGLRVDDDPIVRALCARGLGGLRPPPHGAVAALCASLDPDAPIAPDSFRPSIAAEAARAVGSLRATEAVPGLIRLLGRSSDRVVLRRAAEAIGCMGEAARPAVSALAALVRETDDVGYASVSSLAALGPVAGEAATALAGLLTEPVSEDRRIEALVALGSVAPAIEPAVPALRQMLLKDAMHLQRLAALALGRAGHQEAEVVQVLLMGVADEDLASIRLLGRVGDAAAVAPALRKALRSSSRETREAAAASLRERGLEAR